VDGSGIKRLFLRGSSVVVKETIFVQRDEGFAACWISISDLVSQNGCQFGAGVSQRFRVTIAAHHDALMEGGHTLLFKDVAAFGYGE
jgi:hypothetical protein